MQTVSRIDDIGAVECACGCGRMVEVDSARLEEATANRVKDGYRPKAYCENHGEYVVSGATGYIYASLECLNWINEE